MIYTYSSINCTVDFSVSNYNLKSRLRNAQNKWTRFESTTRLLLGRVSWRQFYGYTLYFGFINIHNAIKQY